MEMFMIQGRTERMIYIVGLGPGHRGLYNA